MLGGDWVDIVVGPLAVGVALVFGVEFVRAREAGSVGGGARWSGDVGSVGDWAVVAYGRQEHVEDPSEDVQVHGVASHVLHLRVEMWPPPQFGVD